jgi:hypothetical protein
MAGIGYEILEADRLIAANGGKPEPKQGKLILPGV